jgi:hypothetical protein
MPRGERLFLCFSNARSAQIQDEFLREKRSAECENVTCQTRAILYQEFGTYERSDKHA